MATFEEVDAYLAKLRNNEPYTELAVADREKAVFTARELLLDEFPEVKVTERVIAIQVLYILEGDRTDFGVYKRQGITRFQSKDLSVDFAGTEIAPAVYKVIGSNLRAGTGRLI